MEAESSTQHQAYSDQEILGLVRKDASHLTTVYQKHKKYCINFMKNMYDDMDTVKDIYQDAVIVLYEKILNPDFQLTCSIQTYLNSICRNQVLKRINENTRFPKQPVVSEDGEVVYDDSINDWFAEINCVNVERLNALKEVLQLMKDTSARCYELLVMFFYYNKTMEQLAKAFDYTNADNAKTQKYKCQEKLKAEVYKKMKL